MKVYKVIINNDKKFKYYNKKSNERVDLFN